MLRLLTWNVEGLNETRLGQRSEKLCMAMLVGTDLRAALAGASMPPMPEVIALQEVVRIAHRGYFAPHLSAAGFQIWPPDPPDDRSYYELLAVRAPWAIESIEQRSFAVSPLRRAAIVARLRHGAARVTVVTAHLESLRSGREARLAQMRQIDAWLRESGEPSVFAGDTNLRDEEWAALRGEPALRDAFVLMRSPPAARTTWRAKEGGRGARFDRVYLGALIEARELRLRASNASDHDGLEVLLTLAPP